MSENLNWIDRLKNSFDGFEPDVQSNWPAFESRLDNLMKSGEDLDLVRQVKSAQRFAIGATTVAAALALWMASPWLLEMADEIQNESESFAKTEVLMGEKVPQVPSVEGVIKLIDDGSQAVIGDEANHKIKLDPRLVVEPSQSWKGVEKPVMGARTSTTFVLNLPETTVRGKARGTSRSEFNSGTEEANQPEQLTSSSEKSPPLVLSDAIEKEGQSGVAKTEDAGAGSEDIDDLTGFNVSVQEACAGTSVSFALNGLERKGSVLWNFGDGGFSQDVAPTHIYENAGTYDITVSVRAPGDGTIRTRTVENMIVVRPKPEARMRWEFPYANPNRATVRLLDETDGASSSTWLVEQDDILNSEVMLDIPGEYHVNLVASNAFGCQDVAVDDIKLGSRKEAIAPALFSPDGDNRYDTFMPLLVMDFAGDWSLSIWDGNKQVFQTSNEFEPWNGRLPNGMLAPKGKKFVWKLETITGQGERNLFVDEVLIDG